MPLASDRRLLLATRSVHKAREIAEILGAESLGWTLLTLVDAGIAPSAEEDDIEGFETFTGNALAKARHFARHSGLLTLADDSGIRVDALGGRPGVRSKRFAARPDLEGEALDRANNHALLEALIASGTSSREAHYVCAAVLAAESGPPLTAIASSSGALLDRPRGSGGFGYDPLFLVPALGLTFAELSPQQKHRISHRGRAFRALARLLSAPEWRTVRDAHGLAGAATPTPGAASPLP
jgi:XTP/dITP diphosphohydrolase